MNINTYLQALINDPNSLYTPSKIETTLALGQLFTALLATSDLNLREYARSLYWQGAGGAEVLMPSAANFIGGAGGNSVDLQIGTERARADYIGDFHTHPYVQKYGAGVSIAPSNGDWGVWWQNPPQHRNVAVHFVASGNSLFLIIFRQNPVGPLAANNVVADASRLNDAVRGWSDDDQIRYGERVQAQNWVAARTLLQTTSPNAIRHHSEDAHSMNCGFANQNRCEYFKGTLNNGVSTLQLASNRVLGNWLTANIWKSASDSWTGW